MACGPDVIFIGGWLAGSYDALSQIAPVVYLATDSDLGVVESVRQNTRAIASLFGLEDTAGELMTGFDSRVAALASFSEGRTAIVWAWLPAAASMCWATTAAAPSSAGKRALPTWGRTPARPTPTHGNEASFEFLVDKDPDYLFVLDRDAAIGTDGAKLAQEVVENELMKGTAAYRDGRIVYLAHPAVWYTAEGGITALDRMLRDLEDPLLK